MVWLNTSEFVKEYIILYFRVDSFYKVGGDKHLKISLPQFVNILVYTIS